MLVFDCVVAACFAYRGLVNEWQCRATDMMQNMRGGDGSQLDQSQYPPDL